MNPRIIELEEKKLIGTKEEMSMFNFNPQGLFKRFHNLKNKIDGIKSSSIFDIQIWPEKILQSGMKPDIVFEKWAAVEVHSDSMSPDQLEKLIIPSGKYAEFLYTGLSSEIRSIMLEFFTKWLPASEYQLDNRPHIFEMDERYKGPTNPESIEIIRIPVKEKAL